ncbi:MAG: hypothetical protein V4611_01955 [Patescibacteria group bacterium]
MNDDSDINKDELATIDIETPIGEPETPQPETPIVPEPKKSKKKIWILLSIIIALLLIGAGAFYYWFFIKEAPPIDNTAITQTVTEPEVVEDTTDYAKELIEKIRTAEAALVTTYPEIKVENSDYNSPAYQPEKQVYYIAGKIGYGILVTDSSKFSSPEGFNSETESVATTILDADKTLTKTGLETTIRYESANVLCSISHESYPFYASCANVRDYATLAAEITPFAEAFKKGENAQYLASSIFSVPTIVQGQDGYKNATVSTGAYESIGGYAGLYYGKDTWTFWRGTQSQIPCVDFNTVELQKSFVGTSCYKENDLNAKVKVTL